MSKGCDNCLSGCDCDIVAAEPWDVGLSEETPAGGDTMKPFVCAVVEGALVEGVINGFRVGAFHLTLANLGEGDGITAVEIVLSREEMLEWSDLLKATGSTVPHLQQQIERKQALAAELAMSNTMSSLNGKESPLG